MANKSLSLIPAERHRRIVELLNQHGTVRVSTLSESFKVSELTIRRDLEYLEDNGILERTYGGAIYSHRLAMEPLFTEKDRLRREEKERIATAAAGMVEDGETIFIHSGSTTLRMFRHLSGRKNLRVVTSNAAAVLEARNLDLDVYFTGGQYRKVSNSLVGPLARRFLQQFNANKCFIGVDGVSGKYGLTTPSIDEAEMGRTMIEQTHGAKIVLSDSSKFGKVADAVTAPLAMVDYIIVDHGFNETFRSDFEAFGVKILIAP